MLEPGAVWPRRSTGRPALEEPPSLSDKALPQVGVWRRKALQVTWQLPFGKKGLQGGVHPKPAAKRATREARATALPTKPSWMNASMPRTCSLRVSGRLPRGKEEAPAPAASRQRAPQSPAHARRSLPVTTLLKFPREPLLEERGLCKTNLSKKVRSFSARSCRTESPPSAASRNSLQTAPRRRASSCRVSRGTRPKVGTQSRKES